MLCVEQHESFMRRAKQNPSTPFNCRVKILLKAIYFSHLCHAVSADFLVGFSSVNLQEKTYFFFGHFIRTNYNSNAKNNVKIRSLIS
jgi:hypothetical protein